MYSAVLQGILGRRAGEANGCRKGGGWFRAFQKQRFRLEDGTKDVDQ